jgi:hypothetical protein
MDSSITMSTLPFGTAICMLFAIIWVVARVKRLAMPQFRSVGQSSIGQSSILHEETQLLSPNLNTATSEEIVLQSYKNLFFKLHNLEKYPGILNGARIILLKMLSMSLGAASSGTHKSGILTLKSYDRDLFMDFLRREEAKTTMAWAEYLKRRAAGQPRELMKDKTEARAWLQQKAPEKHVDGAWLGHISRATTHFSLRGIVKGAFQVLSEELGDGDIKKHHVFLYRQLLRQIELDLPEAHEHDFVHPRHGMNSLSSWRSAVAQMLVSLFPLDFMPEILGFNLHFELLALETLKASKELAELHLDPYYFSLHIAIDNSDSGHVALAAEIVTRYMEQIRTVSNEADVKHTWRRIQAGYALSTSLHSLRMRWSEEVVFAGKFYPHNEYEVQVTKIFYSKCLASQRLHAGCPVQIGQRKLAHWLDPQKFCSKEWQSEFLHTLSNAKPWVYKGSSSKSKLVHALSWGGRMFGCFTHNEVEVLKAWIDSLDRTDQYLTQVINENSCCPSMSFKDICSRYTTSERQLSFGSLLCTSLRPLPIAHFNGELDDSRLESRFLPLWFVHPALLERFVTVPSRTANKLSCAVLRLIRAQLGFDHEYPEVAGIDELRRKGCMSIIDLGLKIMHNKKLPQPRYLEDIIGRRMCAFPIQMLRLAMKPLENGPFLLGLTNAFVVLHLSLASSGTSLLDEHSKGILRAIANREHACILDCLDVLEVDADACQNFQRGYNLAQLEIQKCFIEM